jgi:HSP20 family protein
MADLKGERRWTMTVLARRSPLGELDLLERRMRRLFEGFGFPVEETPAVDVYEADDGLVFEFETPGFDESELEIDVAGGVLVVRGEREEDTERSEKAFRVRERLERRFERRFELPPSIDPERVTAQYAKGLLTVRVPVPAERPTHSVEIGG